MTASTATEPNLQLIATADRRSEWSQAWRRFRANRFAVGGLVVILLLALMAIFAPLFSPVRSHHRDLSRDARRQSNRQPIHSATTIWAGIFSAA